MKIIILTLFPEMIESVLSSSILGRAEKSGIVSYQAVNIRDFSNNKHHSVDDYPYGGGAGMVMQAQPIYDAYEFAVRQLGHRAECIYLSPQGEPLTQSIAEEYASAGDDLILLCGHYEGIDERVIEEIVTREISAGDYVLTGGELPALILTDAISRLVPGVLHNEESPEKESFEQGLLEYPQYSRPQIWRDRQVPEILLSGHHANILKWQHEQAVRRTKEKRPDLWKAYQASHPEEADLGSEHVF